MQGLVVKVYEANWADYRIRLITSADREQEEFPCLTREGFINKIEELESEGNVIEFINED